MPMTSPVLFISGPRMMSTPGNRLNGNTGSLTEMCGGITSSVNPNSTSVSPAMIRAAMRASGTPVALDTYGTVRLARDEPALFAVAAAWMRAAFDQPPPANLLAAMRADPRLADVDDDQLRRIHAQLWIVTQGLASMIRPLDADPTRAVDQVIEQLERDVRDRPWAWWNWGLIDAMTTPPGE